MLTIDMTNYISLFIQCINTFCLMKSDEAPGSDTAKNNSKAVFIRIQMDILWK